MRFNPSKSRRGGVINMTSLIDMMFLLVIFILIAARFEPNAGVEVELPSGTAPVDTPRKSIVVFVTRDREVYLEDEAVAVEDFPERLKKAREAILRDEGPQANPTLVIYGDREVDLGFATELMAAAQRVGQTSMTIRTSGSNS